MSETKQVLSMTNIQMLVVVLLVQVLPHLGIKATNEQINAIWEIGVTVFAILIAGWDYLKAHSNEPRLAKFFGLYITSRPELLKLGGQVESALPIIMSSLNMPSANNAGNPNLSKTATPPSTPNTTGEPQVYKPATITCHWAGTLLIGIVFLWAFVMCGGCATKNPAGGIQTNATVADDGYRVLVASGIGYNSAMTLLGEAYKEHLIPENVKAQIVKAATAYRTAYLTADNLLAEYVKVSGKNAPLSAQVLSAISDMQSEYATFKAIAQPYLNETTKAAASVQ